MRKYIHDLKITGKKRLTPDYFTLELTSETPFPEVLPGQFAEVLIPGANTFLRRPFSIHAQDMDNNCIKLLIRIVGNGTRSLAYLEEGDFLNMIYPLGNSFSLPGDNYVLLIGGGCGIAPLLLTASYFHKNNIVPTILLGARTKDELLEVHEFEKFGKVLLTTDDGSAGEKGLVTMHPVLKEKKPYFDKIYACGPEIMMKHIAKYAKSNNIHCEVSLENMMACGIGACLCCVTETTSGNRCVCTDGPVFNVNELAGW